MKLLARSNELHDASHLTGDASGLRERIATDGYLFFRQLLDPLAVAELGRALLGGLQRAGWTSPTADSVRAEPMMPVRAVTMREAFGDPGYRQILGSAPFNAIPFVSPLADVMRALLGPAGFCYPLKTPRVVYPAGLVPRQPGSIVHKDFRSVQDMFTTWVPLGAVPRTLGALAIEPGSQHSSRVHHRLLERLEPGWSSADYEAGDVIVFHCLTTHAALPNLERRMRISAEYRWQLADQPAPRRVILGPGGREIGSAQFSRTDWWRPVAHRLRLFDDGSRPDRPQSRVPPSRFVSFAD